MKPIGFYGEHILPRIVDVACGMKTIEPLRRQVCEGLAGDVVEIGFGSGVNAPFYAADIARVAAVELADLGWKLAKKRLVATRVLLYRSGVLMEGRCQLVRDLPARVWRVARVVPGQRCLTPKLWPQ